MPYHTISAAAPPTWGGSPGAEGDRQAEALGRQRLENLQLNLPHELDVDLPQPLVPHEVELGILLLQQAELAQGGVGILPLGEEHLVGEHRLQGGGQGLRLCPKALPGGGAAQAGDGHHASRLGLVHGLEPGPRVDAQLIRLLRPAGVALNPATPLSALEYVLEDVDMILLMSVNPGFGGQKFLPITYEKIRRLRRMLDERRLETLIQIDGGVTPDNTADLVRAGADVLVSGSAFFSVPPYEARRLAFESKAEEARSLTL